MSDNLLDSRSDLALTNLQDVMESDPFGSSTQPLAPSTNNSLNTGSNPSLGSSSSLTGSILGSNSSLFNQSTDSLNGFTSMTPMMRKDLSPTLTGLSRLNPTNTSFMLGSFDTDDYGAPCTCFHLS